MGTILRKSLKVASIPPLAAVVVSAAGVDQPDAVRYAYRASTLGQADLYNREGLPASPFASDGGE